MNQKYDFEFKWQAYRNRKQEGCHRKSNKLLKQFLFVLTSDTNLRKAATKRNNSSRFSYFCYVGQRLSGQYLQVLSRVTCVGD